MMKLTSEDHQAIADRVLAGLLPVLAGNTAQPIKRVESNIERIRKRALELAKEGRREESIAMMKSLSKRSEQYA